MDMLSYESFLDYQRTFCVILILAMINVWRLDVWQWSGMFLEITHLWYDCLYVYNALVNFASAQAFGRAI